MRVGLWVFFGCEKGDKLKILIVLVPSRDEETLHYTQLSRCDLWVWLMLYKFDDKQYFDYPYSNVIDSKLGSIVGLVQ